MNVRVGDALNGDRGKRQAPSTSRRRCPCGCGKRATHVGTADGLAMMMGCELHVARWVRDPREALRPYLRRRQP